MNYFFCRSIFQADFGIDCSLKSVFLKDVIHNIPIIADTICRI